VRDFICRDEDFKQPDFDPKELDCRSGGGGRGSGGESGESGEAGRQGGQGQDKGEGGKGEKGGKAGGRTIENGKDAEDGAGVPVTTPKPVPPGRKRPTKTNDVPVLLTEGMPTKESLESGKVVKVTIAILRTVKGPAASMEAVVAVRDVDVKFFDVGDRNSKGFVQYKMDIVNEFYVEEIDTVIYPSSSGVYSVPGLPG